MSLSLISCLVIPALNRGHIRFLAYDFWLAGMIFSLPLITIGAANAFGRLFAYLRGAIVIADWITGIAGHDPHLIDWTVRALQTALPVQCAAFRGLRDLRHSSRLFFRRVSSHSPRLMAAQQLRQFGDIRRDPARLIRAWGME